MQLNNWTDKKAGHLIANDEIANFFVRHGVTWPDRAANWQFYREPGLPKSFIISGSKKVKHLQVDEIF